MPHIRKAEAGNDSFGNEWARDGAVVEVPYEQAVELLAIGDGGFSEVDGHEVPAAQAPVEVPGPGAVDDTDVDPAEVPDSGPVDDSKTPVDEAPKAPARRRGAKAKADDKTVEE